MSWQLQQDRPVLLGNPPFCAMAFTSMEAEHLSGRRGVSGSTWEGARCLNSSCPSGSCSRSCSTDTTGCAGLRFCHVDVSHISSVAHTDSSSGISFLGSHGNRVQLHRHLVKIPYLTKRRNHYHLTLLTWRRSLLCSVSCGPFGSPSSVDS